MRVWIGLLGGGALMAAVALYQTRGNVEWAQLGLVLIGSLAVVGALPPVGRLVSRLLERSRIESPRLRAALQERPARLLLYTAWLGCLGSAGEVAYWLYTTEVSHYRVLGPEFGWQIPVAYQVVFLAVGSLGAVAAWRVPARSPLGWVVFICSGLSFCGWFLLIGSLHELAVVVLAAGLALQVARFAAQHVYVLRLIVRVTAPVLVPLVLIVASLAWIGPRWAERRAAAATPVVSGAGANVLLIVLDTVRARGMSLYGYGRPTTPGIDRFVQRGVVFDHALSTAPWTLPSHGSMFTGHLPRSVGGEFMAPIDTTQPTVAEALRAHGYLTAGFAANRGYLGAEFGLGRGFVHYEVHGSSIGDALRRTSVGGALMPLARRMFATHENLGRKSAEQLNEDALAWMSTRDKSRPYFAFLNYFDVHAPYLPPDEFARRFSTSPTTRNIWSQPLDSWSADDVRAFNDAYDGALAYLDHHVAAFLAEAEARGDLDNTVVIITSDHGEQFGEHGLVEHSASLYMPLLHVPLAVVFPSRVPAGRRVDPFVSLRDLPSTILHLTGVSELARFPGRSLARFWEDPAGMGGVGDEPIVSEVLRARDVYPDSYPGRKGSMGAVVFHRMQYILNRGDGREELYDLARDPEALVDLSAAQPDRVAEYRAYLTGAK
jgi:arylsulfatase A-like enzyme